MCITFLSWRVWDCTSMDPTMRDSQRKITLQLSWRTQAMKSPMSSTEGILCISKYKDRIIMGDGWTSKMNSLLKKRQENLPAP